jgi:hypothetical protein
MDSREDDILPEQVRDGWDELSQTLDSLAVLLEITAEDLAGVISLADDVEHLCVAHDSMEAYQLLWKIIDVSQRVTIDVELSNRLTSLVLHWISREGRLLKAWRNWSRSRPWQISYSGSLR